MIRWLVVILYPPHCPGDIMGSLFKALGVNIGTCGHWGETVRGNGRASSHHQPYPVGNRSHTHPSKIFQRAPTRTISCIYEDILIIFMALSWEIHSIHHLTKGFPGGLLTLNWPSYSCVTTIFSAANLVLAGFPLTNALCESLPSRH